MKFSRPAIGFPLLVKELTELAARKRTYLVRMLYGVLLFAISLLMFWSQVYWRVNSSGNPLSILGRGEDLFDVLVVLQFCGIYLFLPAMTCTAITAEKERDALALLLLTRLGPWTIIFEKLVSRLIPMFTFFLLSLPLMAFAYSFGGIAQIQIWGALLTLVITSIQVAALCLMCSAYFRTTVGAFIAAYVIGAMIFPVIPLMLDEFVMRLDEDIALMFVGPFVYFETFRYSGGGNVWGEYFVRLIPFVLSIAVFLGLTRYFLLRRAFAQPRNLLRKVFRSLDGIYTRLNNNPLTRGIVLQQETSTLPQYRPVAWRETSKKFGTFPLFGANLSGAGSSRVPDLCCRNFDEFW